MNVTSEHPIFFFLNLNFCPRACTKKHRGGHLRYVVCLGVYGESDGSELADHGQRKSGRGMVRAVACGGSCDCSDPLWSPYASVNWWSWPWSWSGLNPVTPGTQATWLLAFRFSDAILYIGTLLTDVVLHPSMPSVLGLAPRGYKIMCVRHVFSSSLLALRYWVLDSTCAFPFTFNPLTITLLPSPIFLAHFHLFWTFFLTTEHIERSHRKLFNHQYHQHVQQKCVDTS